jgi:hypothetical protein
LSGGRFASITSLKAGAGLIGAQRSRKGEHRWEGALLRRTGAGKQRRRLDGLRKGYERGGQGINRIMFSVRGDRIRASEYTTIPT